MIDHRALACSRNAAAAGLDREPNHWCELRQEREERGDAVTFVEDVGGEHQVEGSAYHERLSFRGRWNGTRPLIGKAAID